MFVNRPVVWKGAKVVNSVDSFQQACTSFLITAHSGQAEKKSFICFFLLSPLLLKICTPNVRFVWVEKTTEHEILTLLLFGRKCCYWMQQS